MATYTYETVPSDPNEAPRRFEVQQKMADKAFTHDPETGEPVKRIVTGGYGFHTKRETILSKKLKGKGS